MICIMCSLESEYSNLVYYFKLKKEKKINEDCILAECEKGIVIVKSQVGRESAARSAEYILKNYHMVSTIISAGIAGSLIKDLGLGDIVYSDSLVWSSEGTTGLEKSDLIPSSICKSLEEYGHAIELDGRAIKVLRGTILSSDRIVQDEETAEKFYRDNHTVCVDMESVGVLTICKQYSKCFLAVKTISDYANQHSMIYMLRMQNKVMKNLAMLLYELVCSSASVNS